MLALTSFAMLLTTLVTLECSQAAVLPRDLQTRAAAVIPAGTTYNSWTSLGCYQDTRVYQTQLFPYVKYDGLLTLEKCFDICTTAGYKYAAPSYGIYCYCGNSINSQGGMGYSTTADKCNMDCVGNSRQNCGGDWTNAVYQLTTSYQADNAAAAAASKSASLSSSASIYSATSLAASKSAADALSSSASVFSATSLAASQSAAAALSSSASVFSATSLAASQSAAAALSSSASVFSATSLAASKAAEASLSSSRSLAQSVSVAQSIAAASSLSASLVQSASVAQSLSASASVAQSLSASASVAQSLSASASVAASVSASVAAAAVAATATPTPWVPAAATCIAEGRSGRALNGASTSGPDMTYSKCLTFCSNGGFAIAGLEFGSECYCGNSLVNGASLTATSTNCNIACSGSSTKMCGGPDALTVFNIPSKVTQLAADLTVKAATLPSGWSAASTKCIAEGNNGRALSGAATSANDMTPGKCASYCAGLGFKYAGVEYSSECYCGNSFTNGASLDKASSQCNMPCSGDNNSVCGGGGALSLYTNPSIIPPVSQSTTGVVNNGPLPAGWSAATTACIQEVSNRALTGDSLAGSSMTVQTCLSYCQSKGFQYAGLEYGAECYCGASLVNGASLNAPSSQCNVACAADSTSSCGGPNSLQLYINPSLAPVVAPVVVINGFASSGCVKEVSGRALTGLRVDFPDMTIEKCTAACAYAGFNLAGVEYGQECYCGNTWDNGSSLSAVSGQCYMDCPGNNKQKCGGPNAIQVYARQS